MAVSHAIGDEVAEATRDLRIELPEELAGELAESSRATGYDLNQILSLSFQLYLRVEQALRAGGTVRAEVPGRPDLSFTLVPAPDVSDAP